MTTAPTPLVARSAPADAHHHHRPALRWTLIGLTAFVTLNAVYGGIGLMANGMGMPGDWLAGTPFDSWVLPGIALLVLVAIPQAVALVAVIRDTRAADRTALAVGLLLMAWIVVQVAVLQRFFFLQPVIFALGALEALVAWRRATPRRRDT